jgi:ribulose-5-phosphate 4-epimerase/fuculose-1-phosphate aldolase
MSTTSTLNTLIDDLVTANHILAREGVVDAFGHVSARHPDDPNQFLLAHGRSPELIEPSDIMEHGLDGEPLDARGRKPYLERFIHAALYEARPDVQSVVHHHSHSVIPFGITGEKIRPVQHICATIGHEIPIWDSQDRFGDTQLVVSDMAMGRDFARAIGDGRCALMRGHGCSVVGASIQVAVYTAIYLEVNAELQMSASRFGKIKFLTAGEIDKINSRVGRGQFGEGYQRAWEYWCRRAGVTPRRD